MDEKQKKQKPSYHMFAHDKDEVFHTLGKKKLLEALEKMLLIRNFEIRAESAYLQGKVGGFFHSYIGQEAIQTAAVLSMGINQWWITSYRCHALALLLGAAPDSLMAELYGKATGNAKGRGGSMHFFTDTLLGGFGIVGGQIPIATGAAFAIKYKQKTLQLKEKQPKEVAVCFLGDGAVAQGAFHESLNIAALWDLPCIYVIENNQWGMGTHVGRAISVQPIAEIKAPSFGMKGYTFDGMDFLNCYAGFSHVFAEVKKNQKPVLIEVLTERFKGHSVSDPALYRAKDTLQECMKRDPLILFADLLYKKKDLTQTEYETLDKAQRELAVKAMEFAENSPWPDPAELETEVFAP